ncbi:MAG: alpha/beta fold hydrolase [Thainema sp.]
MTVPELPKVRFLTPTTLKPSHPLFIFLPGMDGTGELLRTQLDGLERSFDIRCLSVPADDLTNWDGLVEQVVRLIRQEVRSHLKRPVYLCGESFGGCLALKLAVAHPTIFDRMILINPASSYGQLPWMHWGSGLTPLIPSPLYQLSTYGLLPFLAALERMDEHARQALLEAMQFVSQKSSAWRLSLLRDFHLPKTQLKAITRPVLLVAGQADRLLPSVLEVQRLARYLPNAKTRILPNSGHACLLEKDVNLHQILQQEAFLVRSRQSPSSTAKSA